MDQYEDIRKKMHTYPLAQRCNKVSQEHFAKVCDKGGSFSDFFASLPQIGIGNAFREIVSHYLEAIQTQKKIIMCLGAHVVKCGLAPLIVDLMERGYVSCVAMNGACGIHDFEIALIGETSEDVQTGLQNGSFGMVEETGAFMNEALRTGIAGGMGAGRALGQVIMQQGYSFAHQSILAAGVRLGIPVTVHIAIGTDFIHQHPSCDGAVLGQASYEDFLQFVRVVCDLDHGIVFNFGSAVIMPEVFLKALSMARNMGHVVEEFTAVDCDMIRHYRPYNNIVRRPTSRSKRGYSITGHHELLIPLLHRAVVEAMPEKADDSVDSEEGAV